MVVELTKNNFPRAVSVVVIIPPFQGGDTGSILVPLKFFCFSNVETTSRTNLVL